MESQGVYVMSVNMANQKRKMKSKPKTIDEYCGSAPGTFKKFVSTEKKRLAHKPTKIKSSINLNGYEAPKK
jgi:hypothetical protein